MDCLRLDCLLLLYCQHLYIKGGGGGGGERGRRERRSCVNLCKLIEAKKKNTISLNMCTSFCATYLFCDILGHEYTKILWLKIFLLGLSLSVDLPYFLTTESTMELK